VKTAIKILIAILAFTMTSACSKKEGVEFPKTSPEEVVTRFFSLLAEGGKITTKEAQGMVSTKYGELDPNDFRRWTRDFSAESKIKVTGVLLPKKPNAKGDWIARVNLEVQTPSTFGGYFTTTSKIHCILDETSKSWKIDFMADTINEDSYRSAPTEAKAE